MTVRFRTIPDEDNPGRFVLSPVIPRGQSGILLKDVLDVFRRHALLLRGIENGTKARLLSVYQQAGRTILARLIEGGPELAATFTGQHYRVVLAQLQAGAVEMARSLGMELSFSQQRAAEAALRTLAEQAASMGTYFSGTVRTFSVAPLEQALSWKAAQHSEDTLRQVLKLRADEVAAGRAARLAEKVRSQLVVSLAAREPFEQTITRIQHAIGSDRKAAEFVARTEHSFAYNAAHHADLVHENEEYGEGYQKSVIVVHDSRTGQDTLDLEAKLESIGGGIPLDAMFKDGHNPPYLHPPGRVNDRDVEIPWLQEWGDDGYGQLASSNPMGLLGA